MAGRVKDGDGGGGVQEQRGDFPGLGAPAGRPHGAKQQRDPERQADGQEDLPQAAQLQVTPTPDAPASATGRPAIWRSPRNSPVRAADDDNHQGAEQQVGAQDLPAGFLAADGLGEQQAARHVGGRHPEHGQLKVPGAGEVAGQEPGDVQPVKAARIGAIVRRRTAQQGLHQEQHGDQGKVLEGGQLAGREVARQHLRMHLIAGAVPSQVVESAEHEQHRRRCRRESRIRLRALSQDGLAGRGVPGFGIVGKIVGVGSRGSRAVGHRGPGRPGKEGRQVSQLPRRRRCTRSAARGLRSGAAK